MEGGGDIHPLLIGDTALLRKRGKDLLLNRVQTIKM